MSEQVSTAGETLSKKDDVYYRGFKAGMESTFPKKFDPVLAESYIRKTYRSMTIGGVVVMLLSIPLSFIFFRHSNLDSRQLVCL